MENNLRRTLSVVLVDGTLYETAPPELRERLQARLRESATGASEDDGIVRQAATLPEPAARGPVRDVGDANHVSDLGDVSEANALRSPPAKPPRRRFGFFPDPRLAWSFAGGGLAGVSLSVILGFGVLHSMSWLGSPSAAAPQTGFIEREIVASHVRALISTRDMDVLSSDQHTVKPWFNGRIDYAPPVVDPSALGFPLVGGRLDYVGARRVAVMVYRYQKHPIDLYVFPDTLAAGNSDSNADSNATIPTTMSEQGYSIMRWKQNGMVFWAITDAAMPNLKSFVAAVKRLT